MPGSVLAGGDPAVNQTDQNACPREASVLEGESEKQISNILSVQRYTE